MAVTSQHIALGLVTARSTPGPARADGTLYSASAVGMNEPSESTIPLTQPERPFPDDQEIETAAPIGWPCLIIANPPNRPRLFLWPGGEQYAVEDC